MRLLLNAATCPGLFLEGSRPALRSEQVLFPAQQTGLFHRQLHAGEVNRTNLIGNKQAEFEDFDD